MVKPILLSASWRKPPAIALLERLRRLIDMRRLKANVAVASGEDQIAGIDWADAP